MRLWSSDQTKGINAIRTYPDLQVRAALASRSPNANDITDEGHIMGEGPEQQFRRSSA
jgi:hypothetical protein